MQDEAGTRRASEDSRGPAADPRAAAGLDEVQRPVPPPRLHARAEGLGWRAGVRGLSVAAGAACALAGIGLSLGWPVRLPMAWLGVALGCAGMVWGAWPWLALRWFRYVPAPLAAHKALAVLDRTPLAARAHRRDRAPEGPLCFMATRLYDEGLRFHGRRPPRRTREPVDDALPFDYRFTQGGAALVDDASGALVFVDLVVERKALERTLERLQLQCMVLYGRPSDGG